MITAGFQNSHVHFTESKWDNAADQDAKQLSANLTAMLNRYGFTTVVDTASDIVNTVALRTRIERGELRGPRILTAGWALYPPNGIPFYLELAAAGRAEATAAAGDAGCGDRECARKHQAGRRCHEALCRHAAG